MIYVNIILKYIFIFFIGSTLGYFLELFFRRIVHGKWVNPGFLVGPYLPIYGFGLLSMSIINVISTKFNFNIYYTVLFIGLTMTLLELIGGLIFLKQGVRLWDYRKEFLNFKGVICPLFSLIWTALGAVYCLFIDSSLVKAIEWFYNNISFSFVLGLFCGVIIIDFVYSTRLYKKINAFVKENNTNIIYDKLKMYIRDINVINKEKYSFALPFSQTKALREYLTSYIDKIKNEGDKK